MYNLPIEFSQYKEHLVAAEKWQLDVALVFQSRVRDSVRQQLLSQSSEELSRVVEEGYGDRTFAIDKSVEQHLISLGQSASRCGTIRLVAEGIAPRNFPEQIQEPESIFIADTVDGTRGIMYDMYSAWSMVGIAPNKDLRTTLDDIHIATMTEIPITKQDKGSVLWAVKGKGAWEEIWDLRENKLVSIQKLIPSTAKDLVNGFGVIADPFTDSGEVIAKLRGRVMARLSTGSNVLNDQVLSSASQLYRLATGKYRFFADLMPIEKEAQCSHPYDLIPVLIAREAGVIVTDMQGSEKLDYQLDTITNCGFIAYANGEIRRLVEPILLEELSKLS